MEDFSIDNYFKTFANCIPVKGYSRSVICDLQRGKVEFIPNSLYYILTEQKNKSIRDILDSYDNKEKQIVVEYFSFLLDGEYIFLCNKDELLWFPEIDITYDTPSIIENAIIDIDANSDHDFKSIFSQLRQLGCVAIQLRFFAVYEKETIITIVKLLSECRIEFVELFIKYSKNINREFMTEIINAQERVVKIIIHSIPDDYNGHELDANAQGVSITKTNQVLDSSSCCGFISPEYFVLNIETFIESLSHNNCLNKKLGIDASGNIKNCPSMQTVFGSIGETKIIDIIEKEEFKQFWTITKNEILICKDCEFRLVCSDCRAFIDTPANIFSKPAKCGYDPYTAVWKDFTFEF